MTTVYNIISKHKWISNWGHVVVVLVVYCKPISAQYQQSHNGVKSFLKVHSHFSSFKKVLPNFYLVPHCLYRILNGKRPGIDSDGNFSSYLIRRSGYGWLFPFPVGGNGNNPIYPLLSAFLSTWRHILDKVTWWHLQSTSNEVIWPNKFLKSMHRLKSAILAILPEIGWLASLACLVSAALHFRP